MTENIKLNLINNSNDTNNSQIVLFQKNEATSFEELVVAWTVIRNCGVGSNHSFVYTGDTMVGSEDSYGNHTPQILAKNGSLFHVSRSPSGNTLSYVGTGSSQNGIEVANDLTQGAINAGIYKSGKLLMTKTSIAPGQKAVFVLKPTLWIGVVSQIEEGEVINSAIVSSVNSKLSLLGVKSADIIMTGGGSGANASAFKFSLENVVSY